MSEVDFGNARVGEAAWVYTCPDGWDEFAWTSHPDTFEEADDPLTVTRQRWKLLEEQTVVFHPRTELCPECWGEGVFGVEQSHSGGDIAEIAVQCRFCEGDGGHPLAGRMEITP